MTSEQVLHLIDHLRSLGSEQDWFEFKLNNSDPGKLGENLSAVANAACLAYKPYGYVVYGVRNSDLEVIGTEFNPEEAKAGGQALLLWLAKMISPEAAPQAFRGEAPAGQQVIVLQVRSAHGCPVKFKGQAYVRIGSNTTALKDHPVLERSIWNSGEDWSAKVHPTATLHDLDDEAIRSARNQFKEKFPAKAAEVDGWNARVFLDKAKVTVQGGITNAALLLLGKPEASSLLSPAIAQISWFLRTDRNDSLDYAHFGPPFILSVDQVLAKVRNLKVRSLPSGTLFPKERNRYDQWVMREALHNCIAHQDYHRRERIQVVERENQLLFENAGSFIPGRVEDVLAQDTPPSRYRNPFLAQAMVNLNMIDTEGGGIRKMFLKQREHAFALPDYDLSEAAHVRVTLEGRILDEAYTQLLLDRTDMDIDIVLLLDRVQRGRSISKNEYRKLKSLGLAEGRYPRIFVAGPVARTAGAEVEHIRSRGLGNAKVREFILQLIEQHPGTSRPKINELVWDMLPTSLNDETRKSRIHNNIQWLVREGKIHNKGGRGKSSRWFVGPAQMK